jgi:hypothetical protein
MKGSLSRKGSTAQVLARLRHVYLLKEPQLSLYVVQFGFLEFVYFLFFLHVFTFELGDFMVEAFLQLTVVFQLDGGYLMVVGWGKQHPGVGEPHFKI